MDTLGTMTVWFLNLVVVVVAGLWIALLVDRIVHGRSLPRATSRPEEPIHPAPGPPKPGRGRRGPPVDRGPAGA